MASKPALHGLPVGITWLASTKFQVQDTRNLDSMLIPSLSFKFTSKTSLKSGFCNACSLVYAQAVI